MNEKYKLPASSYDELIKIIIAYSKGKKDSPTSLEELVRLTGMPLTTVSKNNGFLVEANLISGGSKKIATELCRQLGSAYSMNIEDQIKKIWQQIIESNEFLSTMVSTIQIKGEISKSNFVNHIIFSASSSNVSSRRAGAGAIIEILKVASCIQEKDGNLVFGNNNLDDFNVNTERKKELDMNYDDVESSKKNEAISKDSGYYMQAYTFESGKTAKIIIPEDATIDDLLALKDMLDIVLKRKFKINLM